MMAEKKKTTQTSPNEQPKQPEKQGPAIVKFKSRYAKHTLNFDGVPKIEFTPVSSRDAEQGGVFETTNQRQIKAIRECADFSRGVIKEVS